MVARAAARQGLAAPVVEAPHDGAFAAACRRLFLGVCGGRFRDEQELELALLEWMVEHERHLDGLAHPGKARARLLAETTAYVRARVGRRFGVETLARRAGMSRTAYGHWFRGVTGRTPGAVVREARLEEAGRLLRETRATLEAVAAACGFSGANHLCKAFRARHQMSPGAYRRRLGGG